MFCYNAIILSYNLLLTIFAYSVICFIKFDVKLINHFFRVLGHVLFQKTPSHKIGNTLFSNILGFYNYI